MKANMNHNSILDEIAQELTRPELNIPPEARYEGARLVEAWIEAAGNFDEQYPTLAVEVPWFMFVDKFTIVVGKQDRIAFRREDNRIFGCEWKTAKGTTRYWNSEKWLASIRKNHQIAVYALAQREGYFPAAPFENSQWLPGLQMTVPNLGAVPLVRLGIRKPLIMVRAITKENPPQIWPEQGYEFIEISRERLQATKNALIVRGAQIRAARESGLTPWQLPGLHCENRFSHTMCPFFEKYCEKHEHPVIDYRAGVGVTDPGMEGVPLGASLLRVPIDDPRVVILSASAYEDGTDCLERYRLQGSEKMEGPYQGELDKGTAFHAAVSAYYKLTT